MKRFIGFITASSSYLFLAPLAFAQLNIKLEDPAGIADKSSSLIQFIISLFFALGFILALIFLLWGGVKWIFSRGDKTKVEAAREHIIAAIVGLIFVVIAFLLVNIVSNLLLGKTLPDVLKLPTLKDTTVPLDTPVSPIPTSKPPPSPTK